MINLDDINAMQPPTIHLDTTKKNWQSTIDNIIANGDVGARIVYWVGETDVEPRGKRKDVFAVMRGYAGVGKAHLYQEPVGVGVRKYIAEVR